MMARTTYTYNAAYPPTTQNIGWMLAAVERDDIGFFKRRPEMIKWFTHYVSPKTGCNLLHIATRNKRRKVFDYLLTISEFPLNERNNDHATALDLCFERMFVYWDPCAYEYFACELMKRGVSVVPPTSQPFNDPLLHFSIKTDLFQMAKLLIQMGSDVNGRDGSGLTPLWLCLVETHIPHEDIIEMLISLLYHGADPTLGQSEAKSSYSIFEHAVRWCSDALQEAFFLFMIDDYTSMDVHIEILFQLASRRSPLFHNILEHTKKLIVSNLSEEVTELVFFIDVDYLDLLIQKFPKVMRKIFFKVKPLRSTRAKYFEILFFDYEDLFDSDLVDPGTVLWYRHSLKWPPENEATAMERIYFLSSYGVRLSEFVLNTVYEQFGLSDLLKFVLRMEIEPSSSEQYITHPLLLLLYDVNCDLEQIFEKLNPQELIGLDELLYYFSNPRLRELCSNDTRPKVVAAVQNQPTVPLLVELARNVFRKFFVKTFNIKDARQFYILVDKLPVAPTHKRIITYESKLY